MHPIQTIPPVLTTEEVAGLLRCKPETVEGYVHRHILSAIQIGQHRRFRAEDVLEFISTRPVTNGGDKRASIRR